MRGSRLIGTVSIYVKFALKAGLKAQSVFHMQHENPQQQQRKMQTPNPTRNLQKKNLYRWSTEICIFKVLPE